MQVCVNMRKMEKFFCNNNIFISYLFGGDMNNNLKYNNIEYYNIL